MFQHKQRPISFGDMCGQLYLNDQKETNYKNGSISVTFQVTEDCNLRCTYCYQTHKTPNKMTFETGKKIVDTIFEDKKYIDAIAVELDFIGGEPLLEINLIRQIYEYFLQKCIELNHRWLTLHRVDICSNGTLYFNEDVQSFIKDYSNTLSFSISLDGIKELHDKCRLFPNGEGSYDIAEKAVKHYQQHYGEISTKMTLSPDNIQYTCDAICNLHKLGFDYVPANCIFEQGWELKHAQIFYKELKKIADIFYENDWYGDFATSLFEEIMFKPFDWDIDTDQNWCGGVGKMLAADYKGDFYPCLRYMPSSIGYDNPQIIVGNIKEGLCNTPERCKLKEKLDAVTLTSQSTKECIECPIAKGCAWCSAYNYQVTGTFDKRVTYICVMHHARALANVYYWNKFYQKHNINKVFKNYVPKSKALEIIDEKEWVELCELSKSR